jgi:hypothetical protein
VVRSLADFLRDDEPEKKPLEDIFWEEPVSLTTFVQDFKYLNNPPLSPKQYEAVQHIERIYNPETYPLMAEAFGGYWADPVRMTNLITLQWGKGSGKDHICRISSLRIAYLLLCLKSPQDYFGMPSQDSIHLLNIASNAGQANRAFFKPMSEAVKRGWFKDLAEPKRDTIVYAKHIEAVSGHSEAEGQEGLNLMLGVADEIDAFKAKEEMVGNGNKLREASTSAESILEMLKTSASTRFPESYKRVAISFPRYLGSTIQKLTNEGLKDIEQMGDESREFVSGPFATWVVNPRVKGKHQFAADYRKDPNAAAAKYECKPTRAIDAYFRNMQAIRQGVTEEKQPIEVNYELRTLHSRLTDATVESWEPKFDIDWSQLKPVQGANYAMHADLAIVGDRAGIAMSHVKRWEEREVEETGEDEQGNPTSSTHISRVPIIKNDFTIYFSADKGTTPAREIQIKWARQLAFMLRDRGFHITLFTFDGFQSTDSIQILNNHGIESDRYSLDRSDDGWKTLRDVSYDNRLEFPFEQLLINELESLSWTGKKVDHPPGGSKDLADAFAGSIVGAITVGGEEDADGSTVDVGMDKFDVGPALVGLEGFDAIPAGGLVSGLAMPLGMRGMSLG